MDAKEPFGIFYTPEAAADYLDQRALTMTDHIAEIRAHAGLASVGGERLDLAADAFEELLNAVWQVLDDMGPDGSCACLASKAELISAYRAARPEEPTSDLRSALHGDSDDKTEPGGEAPGSCLPE